MTKVKLIISGMHCTNCSSNLEQKIKKIPGIKKATVNFALGVLTTEYVLPATEEQIKAAIKDLGFEYSEQVSLEKQEQLSAFKRMQLIVAVICSIPLFLAMSEGMIGVKVSMPSIFQSHTTQFVLATIVQVFCGWSFYAEAFASWRNRMLDMSTLVVLGTSAAYLLSIYNVFVLNIMGYFEASAMIITFLLLGKYLENITKYKAGEALQNLLREQPTQAIAILDDGSEVLLDIADIQVGSKILVKANDKIPVDGIVVSGETAIDESTLTGESLAVDKQSGDKVFAGTQNTYGTIVITAVHTGEDTVFASILTTLENAQARQAPIQRYADKVAGIFVPGIIFISVLTFLGWYLFTGQGFTPAMVHAIAVMVIACPCALGLATPISILVSTGRAATMGVLFKGGEELEKTAKVQAVVFDKTGTLTLGKPQVDSAVYYNGYNRVNAMPYIVAVEGLSEHPLAQSVVDFAALTQREAAEGFSSVQGKGAVAYVKGEQVVVGSGKLLAEYGVDIAEAQDWVNLQHIKGMTIVYAAIGGRLVAAISISDTIRDSAKKTIAALEKLGKQVYLLTGDNQASAIHVANMVGIKNVKAGVLPQEKLDFIKDLQDKGISVAMVGDGVNDSLALSQANLAISLAGANALAVDTSDVMLMNKDIYTVVAALRLGEATFKNIKQNLFWALFYNTISIPLAVFGYLSPEIAGLCMALSSVSVVLNSLRIRNFA